MQHGGKRSLKPFVRATAALLLSHPGNANKS